MGFNMLNKKRQQFQLIAHDTCSRLTLTYNTRYTMQAEKKADQINEKFSLIEGIYKKEDLLSGTNNGQGKVFLVSKDKRLFAAKLFLKESDFRTEMRINQLIQNVPGVMRVEFAKIDGQVLNYDHSIRIRPVIIMELGEKGDLLEFIVKAWKYHRNLPKQSRKKYFIPMNVCKAIFCELLERVQSLHQVRILHRDLKTANIILDENYHVRLVDFGLAVSQNHEITNVGAGTTGFSAPQVERREYVGPESDVFSCGVIFYMICFLKPPFDSTINDDGYRAFANAANVQDLQPLWNALSAETCRNQLIEPGLKQLFLRIFKSRDQRPTIPAILESQVMTTRATYEQMKSELHTQYTLFAPSDKVARRIIQLKTQFEAELRDALMIQQQQEQQRQRLEMLPENMRTRSAGLKKETEFYIEWKNFDEKKIEPKKLEIDFEDSSWFSCSPAAALAWISTYLSKAVQTKELVMLDFLDDNYETNYYFEGKGSDIVIDLTLTQKDTDKNVVVRVEGELFSNNKGDKFKIQWQRKQGNDLLTTALLQDVKECTAALNKLEESAEKICQQKKIGKVIQAM